MPWLFHAMGTQVNFETNLNLWHLGKSFVSELDFGIPNSFEDRFYLFKLAN
jgi:hypothetical protein